MSPTALLFAAGSAGVFLSGATSQFLQLRCDARNLLVVFFGGSRLRLRFALGFARAFSLALLLGLAFIHSKGLVHGDFHAGNSLFSLRDISKASIEDLRQSQDMVSAPVRRLDGSNDRSAPCFLTLDRPLREWVATGNDLQIKISDLGSGKKAVFQAES